jgi:hypothetical protein
MCNFVWQNNVYTCVVRIIIGLQLSRNKKVKCKMGMWCFLPPPPDDLKNCWEQTNSYDLGSHVECEMGTCTHMCLCCSLTWGQGPTSTRLFMPTDHKRTKHAMCHTVCFYCVCYSKAVFRSPVFRQCEEHMEDKSKWLHYCSCTVHMYSVC